jgi:hypothetical protein
VCRKEMVSAHLYGKPTCQPSGFVNPKSLPAGDQRAGSRPHSTRRVPTGTHSARFPGPPPSRHHRQLSRRPDLRTRLATLSLGHRQPRNLFEAGTKSQTSRPTSPDHSRWCKISASPQRAGRGMKGVEGICRKRGRPTLWQSPESQKKFLTWALEAPSAQNPTGNHVQGRSGLRQYSGSS